MTFEDIEECRAEHPTNETVVPCCLAHGHTGDHFSTTGCRGSEMYWSDSMDEEQLNRAIVEAAEKWADAFFIRWDGCTVEGEPVMMGQPSERDLFDAIQAKRKALEPTLEDEIKQVVENWLREGKAAVDYLVPPLVALIKGREA